jgi:hypothetical protein
MVLIEVAVHSRENLNQSRLIKLIIDNLVVVDDFLLLICVNDFRNPCWQGMAANYSRYRHSY